MIKDRKMTKIVSTSEPVTLIGAGEATPHNLAEAMRHAPVVVAADGGAALAVAQAVTPRAVIGDFDSLPDQVRAVLPESVLHPMTGQDNTDFDKALQAIASPLVLAVGFTGGRIDHQLAALHVLAAHAPGRCIIIGAEEVIFHVPSQITLDVAAGDTVSLFPMGQVQGRSTGLVWPIDGLVFDPMRFVGTSNCAEGPVQLWMTGPGMLCIAPRRILPALIARLLARD